MRINFWNRQQWLTFGIVFIIAFTLVWLGTHSKWYLNFQQHLGWLESHRVQGQVTVVTSRGIEINGIHILDVYPQNSDYAHPRWIGIQTDANTKFVKTIWHLPTQTDLAQTNGAWSAKIKKETDIGSIDDLKKAQQKGTKVSVIVKTANNSIADRIITAWEINYIIRLYP